jgi:hypothetical protein
MYQEKTREQIEALRDELRPAERILQIIHLNLVVGAAFVLGLFYFQCRRIAGNDAPIPLMYFLIAVLAVVPSFIVPALIRRTSSSNGSPNLESASKLAGVYQFAHIVGSSILEAGILFSALAFRIADVVPQWFVLVPAILLLLLLLRFPLPGKMTDWVVTLMESRRPTQHGS